MKKIVSVLLTVCLLVSAVALFASCKHTCEYATEWSFDDTNHWHACTKKDCTLTSTPIEHIWGEGVETTPATQEADGVKTYTCSTCNHKKTEVIEFTGLSAADWAVMTAPENFINFTYTETAVVSATQITATSVASVAFTKDAAVSTVEVAGQKNSQYISGEDEVEEGRSGMLASLEDFFKLSNWTYDRETKTYKLNKTLDTPGYASETSDAVLTVENGKIVKIEYTCKAVQNNIEMDVVDTITFTDYGTTVAENPDA